MLVGGGAILAVGPELAEPPASWGATVVDLDGCTLIPGLVDVHVHLTGGGGEGGAETRVPPVALTALTRSGVTTAVGLLGTDGTTRSIRELLAAARALDALGLTAFCYTGAYEVPPPTLTGSIRGDIVHVDRIVAVGELAISDHRSSQPTYDELVRIAADAHVAGMMSRKAGLVHLHLGDGERGLALVRRAIHETELPPRVFHPTHCNRNGRLWEESLGLAAEGVWIDVSAFPAADDGSVYAAAAVRGYLAHGLDPGRITVSSDAGGCLPEFDRDGALLRMGVGDASGLLGVVRSCLDAGIEPERALAPVTANPAKLYRFGRKGRIAADHDADLVALGPDREVLHVLARGRWMVRDGAPTVRGWFEGAAGSAL
ncbi:MAG: beta-aspartyl-peptidase [Myxococcota bacterium]